MNQKLSFARLTKFACDFASASNAKCFDISGGLSTSYIDEDGDKITMSSDDELIDAFIQTMKREPFRPFRIAVKFPNSVRSMASVPTSPTEKKVTVVLAGKNKATVIHPVTKRGQCQRRGFPKFMMGIPPQVYDKEFFIHARHTCDGCTKTPIIGARYHATKIPDFDLCEKCFNEYQGEDLDFKPEIFGK